jgi:hypothetical protein
VPVPAAGPGTLVGLLAAQVADLRELASSDQGGLGVPGYTDLGPVLAEESGVIRLLDLDRLLPESVRRPLALGQEAPG